MRIRSLACIVAPGGALVLLLSRSPASGAGGAPAPQYEFEDTVVPAARADEPRLPRVSAQKALAYLESGTRAWNRGSKCVSCHTNGTYMFTRAALTSRFGPPSEEARAFFVDALKRKEAAPRAKLREGTTPAQVVYIAAGLAEWDANVTKKLSPEAARALALMLDVQAEDGTWDPGSCWPPYESDTFHIVTVAATAVATAPGWLAGVTDPGLRAKILKLKDYLRTAEPPHDYARVLLLWAATRMPDLLDGAQRRKLIDMVSRHQRPDGGWSIRTFAAPEAWGAGGRAKKLRAEPDFANPASDGHQTGLAVLVLREAGVPASDPRIQRGVRWLLANQRESGRWWTRSLNTDNHHFITYSGTALPLLALAKCDAFPKE